MISGIHLQQSYAATPVDAYAGIARQRAGVALPFAGVNLSRQLAMAVASPTGSGSSSSQPANPAGDVTKTEFLQLLVAQIKNQDPLNPADGTQFLTQLAQFSQLEQMMAVRADLDALTAGLGSATGSGGARPAGVAA